MDARKQGRRGGGSPLELDIRSVGHGGDGVAAGPDGSTVMVRGGLPGERVLAQPTGRRRGVGRAQLLRVLTPSPARSEPACPHVARCGGCPWMPWDLTAQRETKRDWVARAVAVAAPEGLPVALETGEGDGAPDDGLGYRRTARLAFHRSGQGVSFGYRGAGSQRVVPITGCAVLVPPLQAAFAALRDTVMPQLQGSGEVSMNLLRDGVAVELRTQTMQPPELYTAMRAVIGDAVATASLCIGDSRERFGAAEPRGEAFDGGDLWLSDHGFLQANGPVNRALVREVAAQAESRDKRVLELYAGHGNFTLALSPGAASVLAVEVDEPAVEAGRRNLREREFDNARFVAGDVAERAAGARVDVVVLDPPRTGAKDALPAIVARKPETIVYVSCDTATLSRDLGTLAEAGYEVDFARAFDMFPHSAHVEAIVRLRRRSNG